MIQLITPKDVTNRQGLPSLPEGSPTLLSAIKAAHLRVAGILGTKLDRAVTKDTFYLDRAKTGGVLKDETFCLRLSNGFLNSSPMPTVLYGETIATATVTIPSTEYVFDNTRGYLYLPESYEKYYVIVTYDAGFSKANGVIVQTVPEELTEALTAYSIIVQEFSSSSSVGSKVADQNKRNTASGHVFDVLVPLLRRGGLLIEPLYSQPGTLV